MLIRSAANGDGNAIWAIMESIIRGGETYCLPRGMDKQSGLVFWLSAEREVFVAEDNGGIVGTYCLQPNQKGGGAHAANCGYMTAVSATSRGVARAMCAHSLDRARERQFRAIQFNFVISTNERAVRLWQSFCFEIVGRLPKAFLHPTLDYVDTYTMYRDL